MKSSELLANRSEGTKIGGLSNALADTGGTASQVQFAGYDAIRTERHRMKDALKQHLLDYRIFNFLDLLRRCPELVTWLRSGCGGAAPPPVKRMAINAYLARFELKEFFETGTYYGDTLAFIAGFEDVSCTSIELSTDLYAKAFARFNGRKNVRVLHGDSGVLLPGLLADLGRPALFWLDGHYSGAATAEGSSHTPISQELQAIRNHPIKKHVILIDDARCFDGTNGYPCLDELIREVRSDSNYDVEVSTDIVRITPRRHPS